MDRYKIAILNCNLFNKRALHFPKTGSVTRVVKYIKYCMSENGILIADNIPIEVLNSGVIEVCKCYKLPLVLESESLARMFSISYSYKDIYSYNNVPKDMYINYEQNRNRFVICYDSLEKFLPGGVIALVSIFGPEKAEEFID